MKLSHAFEYCAFTAAGIGVRTLPWRWVQRIGASLSEVVYRVFGIRRAVILNNLRNAYPEKTPAELERIARGSFRTIGAALFEFLWFPKFTRDFVLHIVRPRNLDLVKRLQEEHRGIVLLTLHFGNWELLALSTGVFLNTPLHTIVKTQSNTAVDAHVNRWRTMFGSKMIPMESSVRYMLSALQRGEIIALAADQTAPKESLKVIFFGRETPCFEGPAVFALKTGAPLILGYVIKQSDGTYEAEYLHIKSDDLAGATPENVRILTERHTQATEELIRRHPEQWMWMHKRWKHVPDRPELAHR